MAAYGPSSNRDWPEVRQGRIKVGGYRLHDQPSAPDFYRGHLNQRIRNRVIENRYQTDDQ